MDQDKFNTYFNNLKNGIEYEQWKADIIDWLVNNGQSYTKHTDEVQAGKLYWQEQHLYGSSRLGMALPKRDITDHSIPPYESWLVGRQYELSNHLGNVLATIKDEKKQYSKTGSKVDYYEPFITSSTDYYPFGMTMPGRRYSLSSKSYRFGFNNFEKDDEIKGAGNHISYGDNGYDPRLGRRWNIDPFANKFPFQSPYTHANNSPIAAIDVKGDSTVVVIHGQGRAVQSSANGRTNIMYDVEVYENMTAAQYEVHKTNGTLPEPNYRTELARDAHDITSRGKTVVHSDQRYGTNNETPPGTYYLFKKGTNGDYSSGAYQLYLGDNNGNRVINGPDGVRAGIAIHQYDPNDSQGCLTTCSGRSTQPVTDLMNAIPDLNDDTQPVQLILQEREVIQTQYSNSANGSVKYQGVEHTYDGGTLPEVTITAKKKQ